MKKVLSGNGLPIKLWLELSDMESGALGQAENLANLPFAYHHIAIMPDSHQGYGMPIGGVLATDGVVVPNAVGVDIGCGMAAMKTDVHIFDCYGNRLQKIVDLIKERIPVGMNWHKEPQDFLLMPEYPSHFDQDYMVIQQLPRAQYQLGTLGGGNHFIEIQSDSKGYIWVMIHSGSRNIGKQVADHYHRIAQHWNEKYYSSVPNSWNLAFLPIDDRHGKMYMDEMKYCVDFARANRRLMMNQCITSINEVMKKNQHLDGIIDVSHNYARWENHFNKNVVVHRKGATSAREGEIGIIPGSMGTHSYIVKGLGNPDSFTSCSHGAGRAMSRKSARANLSLSNERSRMEGIICDLDDESRLDEAPSAYKDINVVMENQRDLVSILETLKPLAVVKG